MRITDIREKTVPLSAPVRNAGIGFAGMTASALVAVTDVVRRGKPLCGLAFDSVGRYGHGGLLRERFIPRLLSADPETYEGETGAPDPFKAAAILMQDEKPGGHGERPGALGLVDAAIWDLVAKAEEKPLWRVLAERFGDPTETAPIPVYASGGHYRAGDDRAQLADELRRYRDRGYRRFKIKFGGLPLAEDLRRVDAAVGAVGDPSTLAIDCNGTMRRADALALFAALDHWDSLAWVEEPCDPLDYALHAELARSTKLPFGTGENLFSAADVQNLLRHAGLRPDRDVLQMDISLSYGIVEYLKMIDLIERHGWTRRRCYPHAGHLLAFHAVAGLRLGCHEVAPDPGSVLGGYPAGVAVKDGCMTLSEAPGVGVEATPPLYTVFADMLA